MTLNLVFFLIICLLFLKNNQLIVYFMKCHISGKFPLQFSMAKGVQIVLFVLHWYKRWKMSKSYILQAANSKCLPFLAWLRTCLINIKINQIIISALMFRNIYIRSIPIVDRRIKRRTRTVVFTWHKMDLLVCVVMLIKIDKCRSYFISLTVSLLFVVIIIIFIICRH